MNLITNLNMMVEKELELEKQGLRRTRRWIGDSVQATDNGWYKSKLNKVGIVPEINNGIEVDPCKETQNSILARLISRVRPLKNPGSRTSQTSETPC